MKGEVWLYFDEESGKPRPMVIVGHGKTAVELDITFCKITSKLPRNEFDVTVEEWKESGLKRPSVVRCSKILTLSKRKLLVKVAKLTEKELKKVQETIIKYIME